MTTRESSGSMMLVMAATVIVFAGIKMAASIIVPFLLAIFLAIILMPMLQLLIKKGVPQLVALLLIVVMLVLLFSVVGALLGHALTDFSSKMPEYQAGARERFGELFAMIEARGIDLPEKKLNDMLDAGKLFSYISTVLSSFGSLLTNGFVILLTTVFMMLEGVQFRDKLAYLYGKNGGNGLEHISEIMHKINHYMMLKAVMSFATGGLVFIMLKLFGLDYPVLWGVVAFMLNFIPNIGSIIAAVPAVLLALLQLDIVSAIWIAVGFVAINTLIGSIIEPRIMGKGLDLSTLVVFLSLIFWGWFLGPVGMLLSIPLTIMVKIVLDADPATRWMAVLLGERVRD